MVRLAMEALLVSVFAFFWLHSLLWLVRGAIERIRRREQVPLNRRIEYFQRIDPVHRILHVFVIVSFLGLALTGLPIKYPGHPWSAAIFSWLDSIFQGNGGQVARLFHRIFAIVTFGYLATHLVVLCMRSLRTRHDEIMKRFQPCPVDLDLPPEGRDVSWHARYLAWWMPVVLFYVPFGIAAAARDLLRRDRSGEGLARRVLRRAFGPDSMLPRLQDLRDLAASFRWFLWLGPRPRWDRWTYWEKFDYWAVFWGVAVIGTTGLCIWFKELFTSTLGLPGWAINVAMEIHSHEALLATAFIFSIHFFNTHLNPGKFPMDRVIFTGRIDRHEMEHERPALYDRLRASGRLDALRRSRAPAWVRILGAAFGAAAVVVGIVLVVWIVRMEWSNIFHSL